MDLACIIPRRDFLYDERMNFTGLCSVASFEKTACLNSATVDSFAEIPNTDASILGI